MNAQTGIKHGIEMAIMIANCYLGDLNDEEMLQRPCEGCNHIKWQMGHLLASENKLINGVVPESMPELPPEFSERYTKETAHSDDPAAFDSKEALLSVYEAQHAGMFAALASMSDEDLDRETGVDYAPTVGQIFSMQGSHWLMHAGQWAVIRRQLGRPPVM